MKILKENYSKNVRTVLHKKINEGCTKKMKTEEMKLTPEQEKLNKRIARYRSIANLAEDVEITEDNLDEWVLRRTCNLEGWDYQRAKNEILGRKYEGYEI